MKNTSQQNSTNPAQFYRLPRITKRFDVSASSIWNWVRTGKFPAPVKLSPNCTAWNAADVERWAAERIAASQAGA